MPRFVTIHLRCDWKDCATVGEEGDGLVVEKTLALDKQQGKTFLLCKPHLEQFEETVLPLLEKGVKTEPTTRKKATPSAAPKSPVQVSNGVDIYHCQAEIDGVVCGRQLRKRTGMAQHVIRTHGYESLEAYEAWLNKED